GIQAIAQKRIIKRKFKLITIGPFEVVSGPAKGIVSGQSRISIIRRNGRVFSPSQIGSILRSYCKTAIVYRLTNSRVRSFDIKQIIPRELIADIPACTGSWCEQPSTILLYRRCPIPTQYGLEIQHFSHRIIKLAIDGVQIELFLIIPAQNTQTSLRK